MRWINIFKNEDDDDDNLDEIEEIDFESGSSEQPQRKNLQRKREIHDTIAVRSGTPPEWER